MRGKCFTVVEFYRHRLKMLLLLLFQKFRNPTKSQMTRTDPKCYIYFHVEKHHLLQEDTPADDFTEDSPVKDFTVGHRDFGFVRFPGETNIGNFNLTDTGRPYKISLLLPCPLPLPQPSLISLINAGSVQGPEWCLLYMHIRCLGSPMFACGDLSEVAEPIFCAQ